MVSWQQSTLWDISSNNVDYFTLENSNQRAWVEIDLKAIAHNIRQVKKILAPETELMAVVKADAYGHGAVTVAKTALANGATTLAIATLAEGVELRRAGIAAPIIILGAINEVEDIKAIAAWQLEPTIVNSQQAEVFDRVIGKLGDILPVHLKIDTGMSRLGTNWQEAADFTVLVANCPHLDLASIYSHFATADELDRKMMDLQHQRFCEAIADISAGGSVLPKLHLANSAATLRDRSCHYDLVRVGLALYGLYPASHLSSIVNLKPALQVKAKITQVKTIPEGTGVSYGHRFISDRDTKIAVVGIGYADGVPRNMSDRLKVIVCGRLVSQIGAITMDQLMLDVSEIEDIQVGEIVTLIGCDRHLTITAEDWANKLNTISWEILCGFKHRLPRIIKEE